MKKGEIAAVSQLKLVKVEYYFSTLNILQISLREYILKFSFVVVFDSVVELVNNIANSMASVKNRVHSNGILKAKLE